MGRDVRGDTFAATGCVIAGVAAICLLFMWTVSAEAMTARNGPIFFSDSSAIWKIQPNGTKLKRLTRERARSIDVSPNGRTLLYTHDGLFKMPVGGGRRVNLLKRYPIVSGFAGVDWARWSPNGKRIVFAGSNDSRIYVIRASGKGLKYLFYKFQTGLRQPVWSPNGREIAYIDVNRGSSIMAINLRTKKLRKIYSGSGTAGTPVDFDWHPDGSRIVFYAPYRNWMINSDGTNLRKVSPEAAFISYENPVFSPDGRQLLGRAFPVGGSTSELWLMDGVFGAAAGGYVRQVTGAFSGSTFAPEWAPLPRKTKR